MKIDIVHPGYLPVQPDDLDRCGLGGNETALVLASRRLAARGHEVRVFADCSSLIDHDVRWQHLCSLSERDYRDVIVFWVRTKRFEPGDFNAPVRVAKLGLKTPNESLLGQVLDGSINILIAFSNFQRDLYVGNFDFPASANWVITADGLDTEPYIHPKPKVRGKFLHAANPRRGLRPLLDMWPAVHAEHPDAELLVASSHLLRGITAEEDQRRAGDLYRRAIAMEPCGVRFLGRTAKPQLVEHQLTAQFYLYPTDYPETCCIAALEAAAAGEVILCSRVGALPDRVDDGVSGFLVEGDPSEPAVVRSFLDRIGLLMGDPLRTERMGRAARDLAASHDYSRVLPVWEEAFEAVLSSSALQ